MPVSQLTLYSREGCHLCEDMQNLLPAYLDEAGLSFDIVYIDNNSNLEQQYGTLVPVLKAGEKEICHYFLDVKALQQYISELGNPLN
ncbi:MAG: glutaredoxin family protein [Gammaproteobacteria bacterium]|nr:glutaredoxin family protein [Gammaproteobacteria bacterium]